MYGKQNRAGAAMGCGHASGSFGYPFYGAGRWGRPFRRPKYNVPVNIAEIETAYEVYVYALGFAKENIKVSVAEDLLYITGTRTLDEANAPQFRSQEYPIKNFERVIALNDQVDTEYISARQEEGVLIVTLPKKADAQRSAQEITII